MLGSLLPLYQAQAPTLLAAASFFFLAFSFFLRFCLSSGVSSCVATTHTKTKAPNIKHPGKSNVKIFSAPPPLPLSLHTPTGMM